MKATTSRLVTFLVMASLPFAASAAELAITPGAWETTMTRSSPFSGKTTTQTRTECVERTSFDPESMMQGDTGECTVTKNEITGGDTLNFTMQCESQGGNMSVDGVYRVDGDEGSGNMTMVMKMGGNDLTMTMEWTAKRIGDC